MEKRMASKVSVVPIESGIPIPPERKGGPPSGEPARRYEFGKMKVGDSVFIKSRPTVYRAIRFFAGNCVTRREGTGWRLWRVRMKRH